MSPAIQSARRADLRHRLFQRLRAPPGDRDLRAAACQLHRGGLPQTGAAAGHERHLAVQQPGREDLGSRAGAVDTGQVARSLARAGGRRPLRSRDPSIDLTRVWTHRTPLPSLQTNPARLGGAARAAARRRRSAATCTSATARAASTTPTRASFRSRPHAAHARPRTLRLAVLRLHQEPHPLLPRPRAVHPPFRRLWVHNGGALLEFPPVISGDHIFQLADDGMLERDQQAHRPHLLEAAPGLAVGLHPRGRRRHRLRDRARARGRRQEGRVVALDDATGGMRWSRALPSPSESSPLVDHGRVFFGSQNGTVYALNATTAASIWTYHAAGAVKASPTLSGGVLYFGDYSGHVQAISERTGQRLWVSGSEGALLGSGTFYSTAAVIYGRVFLGNTDGRVYAYDASTGGLDWAVQTGAYVYASPAVTNAPGLGPTDLPRLLQRHLLRAERPLGPDRVAVRRARAHLRLGDDHRAHRLLRRPRRAPHLRPGHLHRPGAVRDGHRARSTR